MLETIQNEAIQLCFHRIRTVQYFIVYFKKIAYAKIILECSIFDNKIGGFGTLLTLMQLFILMFEPLHYVLESENTLHF